MNRLEQQLDQTRAHQHRVAEALAARGAQPLRVKNAALLRRVAEHAGDARVAELAADVAGEERAAAAELTGTFPQIAFAVLSSG
ncbi:MAG TPA: hypothetical protein VF032_19865 [Thermoleophilaceae bacterium]